MPFAPFVGVNNHYQCTFFGCALLREETADSFKWLFRTFKECMDCKEPKSILTNNCHQMALAIADVFPDTSHRVCKWHVQKKAKENMGNIYSKRSSFKGELNKVINQSFTVEEFEKGWQETISKYGLENSVYLRQIWDIRERWAFAYFADIFYAGMTTTQRSESANHVFKTFVTPSCSMSGFVKRYERFFNDRLQLEDAEEFHTENEKVEIRTKSPLERHTSKVYTRTVFDLFAQQLSESLSFMVQKSNNENVFKVIRLGRGATYNWRRMEYDMYSDIEKDEFSCVRKMFEHKGILCSHVLRVMLQIGVCQIPERYVLKRWTKDARDYIPPHLYGYKDDVDAAASKTYRHAMLHKSSTELVRLGNTNMETYSKAMDVIGRLVDDLKKLVSLGDDGTNIACEGRSERLRNMSQHLQVDGDGSFTEAEGESDFELSGEDGSGGWLDPEGVLPPMKKCSRGRLKVKRMKSQGEEATIQKAGRKNSSKNKNKNNVVVIRESRNTWAQNDNDNIVPPGPPRYCGDCGGIGHNARTCGKRTSYIRKYHYK